MINGSDHYVTIKTSDPFFIPDEMVIELATARSYGGPRGGTSPVAKNIYLNNNTRTRVILNPGTVNPVIKSEGRVEDQTKQILVN